jgi:hypothetical protein
MLALGAIALRTETELILKSRRVVPGRLAAGGFRFEHPEWPGGGARAVRPMAGRRRRPCPLPEIGFAFSRTFPQFPHV